MRLIELDMKVRNSLQPSRAAARSQEDDAVYRDTDEPGEGIQPNTVASPQTDPNVEVTTPVYVNPEFIRTFYRRQPDRLGQDAKVGTRIVFNDGGHIIVTNPVSDVVAKISGEQSQV